MGSFIAAWTKVKRAFGFERSYNIILFFIFGGAMFGFCLARLEYLSVGGIFQNRAAPGEWYVYQKGSGRIGITLHLVTIVPGGILLVGQFLPFIRHRLIIYHRIEGYIYLTLFLVTMAGVGMIIPISFGGVLSTQLALVTLGIIVLVTAGMGYWNIRFRRDVKNHRKWMIRHGVMMGTIVTVRLYQITIAHVITAITGLVDVWSCDKLRFMDSFYNMPISQNYPACSFAPNGSAVVFADFKGTPEQIGASLSLGFGTATWMALVTHVICVETYFYWSERDTAIQEEVKPRHSTPDSEKGKSTI